MRTRISCNRKNENVEIEMQDSKQTFIFGNDDDKRVSNTANDMSDTKQEGECISIYNILVCFLCFMYR